MRLLILLMLFVAASVSAEPTTYQLAVAAQKCGADSLNQLTCSYEIGKSLKFEVIGIGLPDTAVTIERSNYEGDYYLTFGKLHGCFIIKPGRANKASMIGNLAFVSPNTGLVYPTWQECGKSWSNQ